MKFVRAILFHAFILSFCGLMTSCAYFINTVQFSEAKSKQRSSSEGIVTNKSLQLNASFPRVISRATPLTLHAEGRLIKKDGTKIPFVINKRYEVEKFKTIASWVEVAQAI